MTQAVTKNIWMLRVAVAVAGLVPVSAGVDGMVRGIAMVGGVAGPDALDSHMRYLSGLLFGIGLAFWSLIPKLMTNGRAFRMLTFIVVIGGLGRLMGVLAEGLPPAPMVFGLVMELLVAPALCLAQWHLQACVGPDE